MKKYDYYMEIAITEARQAIKNGEPSFGGVIINKKGEVIAISHDTVVRNHDMSKHSELNLVNLASKKIGADLSQCTVICTCEPCPLCFTAIWLAKIKTVVFGSYISDALKILGRKQRELNVASELMNKISGNEIKFVKEIKRKECINLFKDYLCILKHKKIKKLIKTR